MKKSLKINIPYDVFIFAAVILIKSVILNIILGVGNTGYIAVAIIAYIGSASIAVCILPSLQPKSGLLSL